MKIVAEHLVILPIELDQRVELGGRLYKVLEVKTQDDRFETSFYRESWLFGNLYYEKVNNELFFEQSSKKLG